MKTRKLLVLAGLFLFGIHSANAHLPSGWVWFENSYMYSQNEGNWLYLSEDDSAYYQNTVSGRWFPMSSMRGWRFIAWPYAYAFPENVWLYFSQTDTQYVFDPDSGEWSRLGVAGGTGDVVVTLTWGTSADLDLYVTDPAGEQIWYRHKQSSSGGELDVDDTNGFGPENIFWPTGGAPNGDYAVVVKHYGGALPTDYTVVVTVGGQERRFTGTLTGNKESHAVTSFRVSGAGGGGLQPPTGLEPSEGDIIQDFDQIRDMTYFGWNPVPGASAYKFRLEGPMTVTHDPVESAGVYVRDLGGWGNYRWRVATYDSDGQLGAWSPWVHFVFRSPRF